MNIHIRRATFPLLATLAVVLLYGCAKKAAENTSTGASSDSLLAASPIEPSQGQLQPQTSMPPQPAQTPTPQTTTPQTQTAPPAEREKPRPTPPAPAAPTATVAAGTGLKITMGAALSSETATLGQTWTGMIAEAVTVGSMAPFPAGILGP